MIVVIGSPEDPHALAIHDRLHVKGVPCCYLDTRTFPQGLRLNLTPSDAQHPGDMITPDGQRIPLEAIKAVYWRYYYGVQVPQVLPQDIHGVVFREIESALGSLFRNLPHARWVNSVTAVEKHRYKAHQLMLMAKAGIPVPETLVSNDPEAAKAFYDRFEGNVIFKPVSSGAHTQKMSTEDVSLARLNNLQLGPAQFQQCIAGVDIRVYVIGEALFAAEIHTDAVDFRTDISARILPTTLPSAIAAQCHQITKRMDYCFTGIDLRRTPEDNYVFLEANPSPMFLHFEQQTGFPISEQLIRLLTSN